MTTNNPFIQGPQLRAVREALGAQFRLVWLTFPDNEDLTLAYMAQATGSIAELGGGGLEGLYGVLHETATLLNQCLQEPGMAIRNNCDGEDCKHLHAQEDAFVDAAARGDYGAVVRTARAVVRSAHEEDGDPQGYLIRLHIGVTLGLIEALANSQGSDPTLN